MNHYRRLQFLLVMFLTATFGMAQTDSTKVQNDSITWNKELEGVTVIFAWMILSEQITIYLSLGTALILLGMYLADKKKK